MGHIPFGKIRIVTNTGVGDRIASVGTLESALKAASRQGEGIVELATTTHRFPEPDSTEQEQKPCPVNPDCPVSITLNRAKNKLTACAKGSRFPKECISCAGRRIVACAGFLPELCSSSETTI